MINEIKTLIETYIQERDRDTITAFETLRDGLYVIGLSAGVRIAAIKKPTIDAASQAPTAVGEEILTALRQASDQLRKTRRSIHMNINAFYGATTSQDLPLYGLGEGGFKRGELATLGGTLPYREVSAEEAKPVRDLYNEWVKKREENRFPAFFPIGKIPIPDVGRGTASPIDFIDHSPFVENVMISNIHIAHVRAQESAPVSPDNGILFCRPRQSGKTNLIARLMIERLREMHRDASFNAMWEEAQRQHELAYRQLTDPAADGQEKSAWNFCSDPTLNQLINNLNSPKEDTMQPSTRNQIALELGPKIRQHRLRNSSEVVVNGEFQNMGDFTGNEVTVIDSTENKLIECGLKDTFLEIQAPNIELGKPYMFRLVQLGENITVQRNDLSNALIKFCQLPDIGRLIAVANQQPPLLPVCSKYMVQNHYGRILKMKDHSFIKGVYLGLTALGKLVWVDEGSLTDPKECLTADEITKLNAHVLENAPEHYDAEFIQRVKRGYGWGPLSHGNSFEGEVLVVLDDELFAINKETGVIEHWLEDATTELKAAVSAQHGWTDASVPEDVLLDHLATLDDNDKVAKFHYSHVTKDSDGDRTCDHGVIFTMLPAHPMYNYYRKLAEELEGDE